MNPSSLPTNATLRKDRLYAQLASSLKRLRQQEARTTDLMENLQEELDAMRTFAGIHAAQFMMTGEEFENSSRTAGIEEEVEEAISQAKMQTKS